MTAFAVAAHGRELDVDGERRVVGEELDLGHQLAVDDERGAARLAEVVLLLDVHLVVGAERFQDLVEPGDVVAEERDARGRRGIDLVADVDALAAVHPVDLARPAVDPGIGQRDRQLAEEQHFIGQAGFRPHVADLAADLPHVRRDGAHFLVESIDGFRAHHHRIFLLGLPLGLLAQRVERAYARHAAARRVEFIVLAHRRSPLALR